jgi:phage replication-related protein YjqB (UPF0714/DUF867 family)
MHRQVVAFSTLAIEQTPAAPGFAHKQQPSAPPLTIALLGGDVAGRTIELATLQSSELSSVDLPRFPGHFSA